MGGRGGGRWEGEVGEGGRERWGKVGGRGGGRWEGEVGEGGRERWGKVEGEGVGRGEEGRRGDKRRQQRENGEEIEGRGRGG